MGERKKYLDLMKFIGIACLFLAHVQGPFIIEEIRGFDVPMMVIISGILAPASLNRVKNVSQYISKRVKRLVYPTWIFLAIFYIAMIVVGQKPELMDILKSYLFQRDCGLAGGVWIIWVYLICTICTPFINRIITKKWYFPAMVAVLIIYEIVILLFPKLVDIRFIYYSFFTIIPYAVLLSIGMLINKMSRFKRYLLCGVALFLHVSMSVMYFVNTGTYLPIAQHKYPARFYYLSYGLSATIILMELLKNIEYKIPDWKLVRFVSEHSLWIYLWQIMILTIIKYVIKINDRWILSWMILMIGSIFVVWIQSVLINWISKKKNWIVWNYFKG